MPYAEITIDQGATFETTIDLIADDGASINVAGYSFQGQIRKSYYSGSAAADFIIQTVNAETGNVKIHLSPETTSTIQPGRYVYDVKMTDTANVVTRIVEGIVTVTPQVTK
jgi:hypothetical protein